MSSLGIDFGTSTTAAVASTATGVSFMRDAQEHEIIPTVLGWSANQRIQTGYAAKARLLIDAKNTLHSFKRILGKDSSSIAVQKFREQYPDLELDTTDGQPRFVTRGGKL